MPLPAVKAPQQLFGRHDPDARFTRQRGLEQMVGDALLGHNTVTPWQQRPLVRSRTDQVTLTQ